MISNAQYRDFNCTWKNVLVFVMYTFLTKGFAQYDFELHVNFDSFDLIIIGA